MYSETCLYWSLVYWSLFNPKKQLIEACRNNVLKYNRLLSYSSGPAPLKMYRELQHDMGPYRTVRIALYMFTQVNMYVQTRHTYFTLLRVSGLAVG